MKILLNGPCAVPLGSGRYGGIEGMVYSYTEGLLREGHAVTVAAPIGSKLPNGAKLIETVKIPDELDRDDIATDAIAKAVMDNVPDIIHDFSHRHFIGLKEKRAPAIFMMWDPIYFKYPKACYNVVCVSHWQKERFEKKYGQKAVVGATGFIDLNIFKPSSAPRNDRFLFLGKLSPEKGPDLALQYANELDVPLDIVGGLIPSEQGSRYPDFLRQEAGNGDKWKIHFNVTEEEKLKFLQTCKAMIYPVRQEEAHWLAGIEAWCCDTETIAADKGAMRSIMPDPLVARDKTEFLKKMQNLETWRMDSWGALARGTYSVEACVSTYVPLYQKVISGARW